jgi:hypothetical protein
MKIRFLLPHKWKRVGWWISVPFLTFMTYCLISSYQFPFLEYRAPGSDPISFDQYFLFTLTSHNFTADIGGIMVIIGLLLVAFSKERQEDERIQKMRLESWLWAVFVNSVLLILSIGFIYGGLFLTVMAYNMCTPLILFIARFNLVMYTEKRKLQKEVQ